MNLLSDIKENDTILYCDAGSSINNSPRAINRLSEFLKLLMTKMFPS